MSNFQIVSDGGIQWSGNTGTLVVKYSSSDATTTGLGLRIHYDNASMNLVAATDLLTSDNISQPQLTPYSDSDNFDDNPATDSYVTSNWASLFGSWPGSTETDLVTLTFEKVDGGSENYDVGYTASSTAAGFEFNPQPMSVSINDVDENSGAAQVIATVNDAPEGATYSLVDNTAYPVDEADAPAETQINIPELQSATQHVYASDATISEDGSQLTVVVSYGSQDDTTTGLGLRIHYDSTALTLVNTAGVLTADNISAPQLTPYSDSGNDDGDATTDSYVTSNWASLFGNWPGDSNADLVTLIFDIAEGAEGPTAINFSAASNAAGNAFDSQDQIIQLPVAPVDPSELSIDAATGAVTLDVNPDYEARSEYSFDVIANVGGAEETASATFTVGNADELAPVFDSGDSASSIDENSGAGQVIYTAAAHDDAGDATSEPLTYSLSDDSSGAFSIDSASGAVTLVGNPDFEAAASYSFTVEAADGAGNSASQQVSLAVTNQDDSAPVFDSGATAAAIDENSGAGQVVYTAQAQDNATDVTSAPL
ncbi:MAG: cadherin repeat domain-containing protein, partial [Porticoccaceae bacterium]|nr:cadherin repeat domain-containing protein [Porticoccaceae bacterium]